MLFLRLNIGWWWMVYFLTTTGMPPFHFPAEELVNTLIVFWGKSEGLNMFSRTDQGSAAASTSWIRCTPLCVGTGFPGPSFEVNCARSKNRKLRLVHFLPSRNRGPDLSDCLWNHTILTINLLFLGNLYLYYYILLSEYLSLFSLLSRATAFALPRNAELQRGAEA